MTISVEQVVMVIIGLGGVISTLGGVIYRMLTGQLAECKAENASLRAEAKETVRAKDAEKDEWRRMAQQSHEKPR